MPNVKISAAADAGTLLSSDMLPLARSGDTNAYHATVAEIAAFASTSVSSGAYGNTGRNLLHNPMFNVWQRGTGPWTTPSYTADRWALRNVGNTVGVGTGTMTDTNRAAIGDESARTNLSVGVTGVAGAGNYTNVAQYIEDVTRLSGKTVTVSFWAWASVALNLGVSWDQYFGSGGSPSATVQGTGQVVAITTTPAHYSVTFALPSTSGKTLGTNADSSTDLYLTMSTGATSAAFYGNTGVQSGTFAFWGVQLEIGSAATPLAKRDKADDLALCQRFYQIGNIQLEAYNLAGANYAVSNSLSVCMRAAPTMTFNVVLNNNCSVTVGNLGPQQVNIYGVVTATGPFLAQASYTASADF